MSDRDVAIPEDAVPLDFEQIAEDGDCWKRASEAEPDVRLGDRDDLFVVEMDDSDDAHNLSLVQVGEGDDYRGWCSCDGFEYHDYCSHLCVIRQRATLNDHLIPTVDEDDVEQVDAEVVDHVDDDPDQDDVDEGEDPDTAPQEPAEPEIVDAEPQGSDDASAVATPSDPFAEQLAQDVPERFVMELGGDTYIRRAGYARIARVNDLRLSLDEVVGAHETDWEHSKYRATVTTADGDPLVENEVGSAHLDHEDLQGAGGELDELAATRAARRAIEWATGAGATLDASNSSSKQIRADGGVSDAEM